MASVLREGRKADRVRGEAYRVTRGLSEDCTAGRAQNEANRVTGVLSESCRTDIAQKEDYRLPKSCVKSAGLTESGVKPMKPMKPTELPESCVKASE